MRQILAVAIVVVTAMAASGCAVVQRAGTNWWELERGPSGQAPDPATTSEPVVQVYAARTVGLRGLIAVHTWIAVKPRDAGAYTRYEVIGWGVDRGLPALRVNRTGPDNFWFGAHPERLVDLRGEGVDAIITRVEAAVAAYPYPSSYRMWPGPNSNTFTAWVGQRVPELGLRLPVSAIGKNYLCGRLASADGPYQVAGDDRRSGGVGPSARSPTASTRRALQARRATFSSTAARR